MIYKVFGVIFYLGILLFIGIVASRRMKDLRDYYVGGKKLGFLAVAFSARATGESAWLLLGLTGMGAAIGVKAFWVVLGEVLGVGGAWLLMSRRFKRMTDRYDSVTVPDYLESRFRDASHLIRLVSAVSLVIFTTIYVSAQIDATGTAFESFLGIDYYLGALIGFAVVLVYIISGGFVAVVWSDVFQGILMVLGLALLPIVALWTAGGIGEVSNILESIDPNLLSFSGEAGWSLTAILSVIGLALIGLGFLGSPQIFVRFLSLRSESEITKGTWVAILWTIIADSGAVLVGLIGRSILIDTDLGQSGQDVLPLLVEHVMPALLVGLYIAIVLSAIMSTVDSLLVLASSALVRDWYQKVKRPDLKDVDLVQTSRKATFFLALVALIVAMGVAVTTPDRTVFWFVIFGWSGIAATFCPTIILSLFWHKMTLKGAISAMVAGFLCVPLFKFVMPKLPEVGAYFDALAELPPAFLISGLVGIFVSLFDHEGQKKVAEVREDLQEASK